MNAATDTHVNPHRLLAAQITAALFASLFTAWTAGLAVLVLTFGVVARAERTGYALSTGAAAICLWVVFTLIYRSRCHRRRH